MYNLNNTTTNRLTTNTIGSTFIVAITDKDLVGNTFIVKGVRTKNNKDIYHLSSVTHKLKKLHAKLTIFLLIF